MSRVGVIAAGVLLVAGPVAALGQASSQKDLLFQAEAQMLSGDCFGQPVRLEGNHNTVTLHGACGSLLLKGVSNTVRLSIVPGGSIRVEGSGNRVHYAVQGEAPAIVALGPDNDVAAAEAPPAEPPKQAVSLPVPPPPAVPRPAPPPPPPAAPSATTLPVPQQPPQPGPLVLGGDDAHRLEDCAGRDVAISGNRSDYVLSGACRSLTLKGDLLTVRAEIASGAKISVTGRGNIVTWELRGHGHGPASIVRGEGSRVQSFSR